VLQDEIKLGKIRVTMQARGLVITLQEAAFFPPGEAQILPETIPVIAKVAKAIGALSLPVRLEGHTDASPIQNLRYASNWDLSTARAIAMLNLMTQRFDLPPNRFAVAGYGDTLPVESNDTPAGRARNRRVEVVILNRSAIPYQPIAKQEEPHRQP
jgi:chemotaxis protein MotB